MHRKYPKGHQTPRQLAAERANLARYRARKNILGGTGYWRHTAQHPYKNFRTTTARERAAIEVRKLKLWNWLLQYKYRPLGTRYLSYHVKANLPKHAISSRNKRFVSRLGPGNYGQRTHWGATHKHHFRKRVRPRKKKFIHVKRWRHLRHRVIPQ
jgi:hypothetical protein